MTSPEGPVNPIPIPSVAKALSALGYKPENMILDATIRMARVPSLARDMISYVAAGQPAADSRAKTPAELFRPLPGNHTVGSLVQDFGFEPVGAFLMGADLVWETEASLAILATFIQQGYWVTRPDGVRELRYPPIAERYPACPDCGLRLLAPAPECPHCGSEIYVQQQGVLPARLKCPSCGGPVQADKKFCPACEAPAPSSPPQEKSPKFCTNCGSPVTPGEKFCSTCGYNVSTL